MSKTNIEWVRNPDGTKGETWNPVTGCTKVSLGCKNCYAERMARRLAGRYGYPEAPHHFDVTLHPDRLDEPLKRKKPTMYFVCSMSDLFHENMPFTMINSVLNRAYRCPQHIFQVLTKRPRRMLEWFRWFYGGDIDDAPPFGNNLWLGVSVENQATADERIPLLLRTPAAVRFVSCEPLLSSVDLLPWLRPHPNCGNVAEDGTCAYSLNPTPECHLASCPMTDVHQGISWVVCGGESGPNARPMHPQWARDIRDQCQAANIPYFHKQNGAWLHESQIKLLWDYVLPWPVKDKNILRIGSDVFYHVGKKRAGRLLDGQLWEEMPDVG